MPDYSKMISPALRRELKRFGLKVIPKNKAVQILEHIYHETHDTNDDDDDDEVFKDEMLSQDSFSQNSGNSQNSSNSVESEEDDVPEESMFHFEEAEEDGE